MSPVSVLLPIASYFLKAQLLSRGLPVTLVAGEISELLLQIPRPVHRAPLLPLVGGRFLPRLKATAYGRVACIYRVARATLLAIPESKLQSPLLHR